MVSVTRNLLQAHSELILSQVSSCVELLWAPKGLCDLVSFGRLPKACPVPRFVAVFQWQSSIWKVSEDR